MQVAVVTGAGSGIGRAVARALLRRRLARASLAGRREERAARERRADAGRARSWCRPT